jgi:CheY-like chemotaxis protein
MGNEARWHWLKHFCVVVAIHKHKQVEDESLLHLLTFQFIVRLASESHLDYFRERILAPIRRVLHDEHVDYVLRVKGVSVDCDDFRFTVQVDERLLPTEIVDGDNESLKKFFERPLPASVAVVGYQLEGLRSRNKAAAEILSSQFRRVMSIAEVVLPAGQRFETLTELFMGNLAKITDGSALEACCQGYSKSVGELVKLDQPHHDGDELEREARFLALLAYYVVGFVVGEVAQRLHHLKHLKHFHGRRANALFAWAAIEDPVAEVRSAAVECIGEDATGDLVEVLLKASRDTEACVRRAAIPVLGCYGGPGVANRLVEILDHDLDGDSRRFAREAAKKLASGPASNERKIQASRVLIVDDEPFVVPPLVDALEHLGAEVRATANVDSLREVLSGWIPELIIVDPLAPHRAADRGNWDDGEALVRELRSWLSLSSRYVPLIVATALNEGQVIAKFGATRPIYLRKPATEDTFISVSLAALQFVPARETQVPAAGS